jgi:hypothetical protein
MKLNNVLLICMVLFVACKQDTKPYYSQINNSIIVDKSSKGKSIPNDSLVYYTCVNYIGALNTDTISITDSTLLATNTYSLNIDSNSATYLQSSALNIIIDTSYTTSCIHPTNKKYALAYRYIVYNYLPGNNAISTGTALSNSTLQVKDSNKHWVDIANNNPSTNSINLDSNTVLIGKLLRNAGSIKAPIRIKVNIAGRLFFSNTIVDGIPDGLAKQLGYLKQS